MDRFGKEEISCFSPAKFESPLGRLHEEARAAFVEDDRSILAEDLTSQSFLSRSEKIPLSFEIAGPRRKLFFDPSRTTAAIVTCGGLCPGLNDIIRGLFITLYYTYGVRTILGVRYGYRGFVEENSIFKLTPEIVSEIKSLGGTILGSSRGPQKPEKIVDSLVRHSVNMLFVVGGDGTMRGARDIVAEITKRGLCISVVGLPKTINNDFVYMDKSFGFETAYAEAVRVIRCAHSEAKGAYNGIGLVKLMGRESGFIAVHSALAEVCVNFVLVPEVPFRLQGAQGLFRCLEKRLAAHGHAVIVVAEGAGQDLMANDRRNKDASGNIRLGDIGLFLKREIDGYFASIGTEVNLRYIDPSYVIRSVPANAQDEIFCTRLAQNAVHAAMAGKTDLVVGRWHEHFIHLPMPMAVVGRSHVDPHGDLWLSVLQSTGQPPLLC